MARRTAARSGLLLLALVVAACGSATPPATAPATPVPTIAVAVTASDAASMAPTSAPTASPAALATPTPTTAPAPTATAATTPSPTPETTLTGGETGRVVVEDAGVALTLPKRWVTLGLSPDGLAALMEAGSSDQDEALVEMAKGAMASGARMLAIDLTRKGLGSSTFVVSTDAPSLSLPLKDIVKLGMQMVPGVSDVKITSIKVDGTTGVRADVKLKSKVSGITVRFRMSTVYLPIGDRLTAVTVGIIEGGDVRSINRIINSLEVLS
jgi:hypothetical protein